MNYTGAYNGLGTIFQEQGKIKEALTCYQQHMQIRPDDGIEVKASLLLPVICESSESIGDHRKRLSGNIDKLRRKKVHLQDPSKQVGGTNFHLAYQGLNNRQLHEKIARFYLEASPALGWQASLKQCRDRKDGKIKIGIISRYIGRHTIGYLNYGVVKYLNREKFHVTVFGFPGINDGLSADIADAADQMIILPAELSPARKIIARQAMDILLYLDIGMDPLTYFLAFSRLAPVQCTSWGHPDTTGIPNMDYYISSINAEPSGAQVHYTEKLILFNEFPMYCQRPQTSDKPVTRRQLDLPEDIRLYACIQSLFKVHPDFDDIIAGILLRDPKGIIVFFEGSHDHWGQLLRERFARRLPEVCQRLRFLKRLSREDFLAFLQIPDVLLDTPHFSGGYTSLLAFAEGTPIVTWPGEFMRGRLTYAWYKRMGIMDVVAENSDAYVDIACKLANDGDWCKAVRNKIKTRAACLYENLDPTRELENFFQWAARKATITGC
jgi:predicted O-linked N-acetylglucosamine transferase (SPINDLY family)